MNIATETPTHGGGFLSTPLGKILGGVAAAGALAGGAAAVSASAGGGAASGGASSSAAQGNAQSNNSNNSNNQNNEQNQENNQQNSDMDLSVEADLNLGENLISIKKAGGTRLTELSISLDDIDVAEIAGGFKEHLSEHYQDALPGTGDLFEIKDLQSAKNIPNKIKEDILEKTQEVPGVLQEKFTEMVIEKITELLESIDLVPDIIVKAWEKAVDLAEYFDLEQFQGGESFVIPMVNHEIESAYEPSIKPKFKGKTLKKIGCGFGINAELEGVMIEVEECKLKRIKIGHLTISGTLNIAGQSLGELPTREIELGWISLGNGIPLNFNFRGSSKENLSDDN